MTHRAIVDSIIGDSSLDSGPLNVPVLPGPLPLFTNIHTLEAFTMQMWPSLSPPRLRLNGKEHVKP